MLTALLALGCLGGISAPPAAATAEVSYGDVLVDDVGGHVFVTSGNSVTVYDRDGAVVKTIGEQYGVVDLMLHDRTVYVMAYNVSRINTIHADELTVTGGWNLSTTAYPLSMTWNNGKIFYTYGDQWSGGMARLDPATGTVATFSTGLYAGGDIVSTDSPARVYVLDRGLSPSKIRSFDTSTFPPVALNTGPHSNACGNGQEMAMSVDGSRLWSACGAPYEFNEWDPSTLLEPTVHYPANPYPTSVDRSANGRLLVGGTDSSYDPDIWVYEVAKPVALRSFEIGDAGLAQGMLAVSGDGSRIYAVSQDGVLHVIGLSPVVAGVMPSQVYEHTPSKLSIVGSGYAEATAVAIDGTSVPFSVTSSSSLTLDAPSLEIGAHGIEVTSLFGTSEQTSATQIHVIAKPPAAAAAPQVTGTGLRSVSLSWTPPDGYGHPITSYVVKAYAGGSTSIAKQVTVPGASVSTTITGLRSETSHRFTVQATSVAGTGAASPLSTAAFPASPELGPFPSIGAFVDRQYADLVGRAPTSVERVSQVTALAMGTTTPEGLIVALRHGADATSSVDPVARLYRATFLRIPDRSGLEYWIKKKRAGTKLTTIAENFVRSSEFQRRYGSLSDRSYVERLYLNVLGRTGDKGGIDYWTFKLASGTKSRGQVLAGMSESSEYRRTQAAEVDVAVLYIAMLRRPPTVDEFDAKVAALDAGSDLTSLVQSLLFGSEYAARF